MLLSNIGITENQLAGAVLIMVLLFLFYKGVRYGQSEDCEQGSRD